eukprot:8881953-Heterocapsa_arctica.AAC.1
MYSFSATESDVGGKISRALLRIAEHRGEHTRLDWANSVDSGLMPSAMARPTAEIYQAVEPFAWKATALERRALKGEVRRRGIQNMVGGRVRGRRIVVGVDSRVVLGTHAKGRSS